MTTEDVSLLHYCERCATWRSPRRYRDGAIECAACGAAFTCRRCGADRYHHEFTCWRCGADRPARHPPEPEEEAPSYWRTD